MKNKGLFICFCILFLILINNNSNQTVNAQDKIISLNYAHFMPISTKQAQLAKQWCEEVEKRTSGKIKITFFPGGTLINAPGIYDGVVNGIADIGFSYLALSKGRFPLTEVIDLPLGHKSGYVATKLANEYYKKFKPKELDDTKIFYLHAHGPGLLITKKPVNKLEDVNGLKVRSTGSSTRIVSLLGGVPVGMPIGDSYDALMKGVVEAILVPVEGLKQWKLFEVTSFVTENFGSAYTTTFFCVMNKNKWDSLPLNIQKIIEQINIKWIEKTGKLWDEMDKEGKTFSISNGIKFIPLSKEEDTRWTATVKPMLDEYVKRMREKKLPGDEALKFALDYLKKQK